MTTRESSTFSATNHIRANQISIVIPVKDNQSGIDRFLQTLFDVTPTTLYPCEIIIVDNNSSPAITVTNSFPVQVNVLSCKKRGPAAARNAGVEAAHGEWILFTDSDCIPTPSTIAGYITDSNQAVAYAGNIEIVSNDPLSEYYRTRETLIPPRNKQDGNDVPVYLVTANSLMNKKAIEHVNGFNEAFKQAGGEDVDLAWRLKKLGQIEYCWDSITQHEFDDGFKGLVKRFIRYGRGNKQLGHYHHVPMFPEYPKFKKQKLSHYALAAVEYFSMIYGYNLGAIKE